MKFYIAARTTKKNSVVKDIHSLLVSKGHSFTSDWVKEGNIRPYRENKRKSSRLAKNCIKNIGESDVFVLVSDKSGRGMYVEIGIALQLASKENKPKIYVIGEHVEQSIFFFHPLVKRLKTIEDVFKDLERT